MKSAELRALRVWHLPKHLPPVPPAILSEVHAESFFLDTCQRQLWIFSAAQEAQMPHWMAWLNTNSQFAGDSLSGTDAYAFLLRVATGLESQVRGETDVFGQLKQAWSRFSDGNSGGELFRWLSPLMQRIFEDTKEIRSRHLQNVGGVSYGSLVRKLLKQYGLAADDRVLIAGAGHIAHSVAPWLSECEVWLVNRTPSALRAIELELRTKGATRIRLMTTPEEQQQAWAQADHAVVCIPTDEETWTDDLKRIQAWRSHGSNSRPRALIHLGTLRSQSGPWKELENFHPLDDLFSLQKSSDGTRQAQIEWALRACEEKALLRSLAGAGGSVGSVTLPHGWEDLALFAT